MRRSSLLVACSLLAALAGACRQREVLSLHLRGLEDVPPDWSTARLEVYAIYSDGSVADVTGDVAWRTSDPALAGMDAGGTIHAVRRGDVTITASLERVEVSARLAVPAIRLIRREPVPLGDGLLPVAMGVESAGHVTVVGSPSAWSGLPLEAAHLASTASPTWDPTGVLTAPAPDLASSGWRRFVMNGAGHAAYGFTSGWSGALAYLDGGRWGWVRDVPAAYTALAIDDAGFVFAASPRWGRLDAPAVSVAVERLDAAGLVETIDFAEAPGSVLSLATASGRTMLLNGGTGTRVFDGHAWSGVAPMTAAFAAPRLRLRDDGTADLVDHAGFSVSARRYDGAAWGDPLVLTNSAATSAVAFGPGGTATVVYSERQPVRATRTRLLLRRFDGATWREPIEISGDAPVGVKPTVRMSAQGRTLALWTSAGTHAWASTFDGAPPVEQSLWSPGNLDLSAFLPSGELVVLGPDAGYSVYAFQP